MPTRICEVVPRLCADCKSSKDKNKDAALLYLHWFSSYTQIKSVPGYDWIKFNQITWYREHSKSLQKTTEIPLPAFFHIALPRI